MKGLPGDLYKDIRTVLTDCGPFNSHADLQPYFNDARLFSWRNNIPNGATKQALVDNLITFLYNKPYDKPNPLIRFLIILSEWTEGGCREELSRLSSAVAIHLGEETSTGGNDTPLSPQISFQEIFNALLSAYPIKSELEMMVKFNLSENLNQIVEEGNLREMIFSLIEWAEARSRMNDLIKAAHEYNPGNDELRALAQKML